MVLQVVKLHQKLGKPIPSTDPVVVSGKSGNKAGSGDKKDDTKEEEEKEVEPVGQEYIEEMKTADGQYSLVTCNEVTGLR